MKTNQDKLSKLVLVGVCHGVGRRDGNKPRQAFEACLGMWESAGEDLRL